jgi:hypothetical protein
VVAWLRAQGSRFGVRGWRLAHRGGALEVDHERAGPPHPPPADGPRGRGRGVTRAGRGAGWCAAPPPDPPRSPKRPPPQR